MADRAFRYHLSNVRLLLAMRESIEAATAMAAGELEALDEERSALSQLVFNTVNEGNYELMQNRHNLILKLNDQIQELEMVANPQFIAQKYEAIFKPRITLARFVEVATVEDAAFLVNLREVSPWIGQACVDDGLVPDGERLLIAQTLQAGLVALLHFQRDGNGNPIPEFFA